MARLSLRSFSSLAGIVLVTLVAAALIIGVIVIVKNRGEQARRDQSVQIAAEDEAANSQTTKSSQSSSNSNSTTSTTATTSTSTAVTGTTNTPTSTQTEQAATELPTTGPSDQLAQVLVVSVLVFSTSFYLASWRARRTASL